MSSAHSPGGPSQSSICCHDPERAQEPWLHHQRTDSEASLRMEQR
jgi:hypothetical protein